MIVMVPLADGMTLPNDFLKGLMAQSIPVDIMVVSRPREDIVEGKDKGWKSKTKVKNMMKDFVLDTSDDYCVFLNNNIIIKDNELFQKMIDFLNVNTDVGVVAYNYKNKSGKHVDIGCSMFRRSILKELEFHNKGYYCDCISVDSQMKHMGLCVKYLDV